MTRVTDPGNPVYVYDPRTDSTKDGISGQGTVIMAVENLPSELPKNASVYFSSVLRTLVPDLVKADWQGPFEKTGLAYPLKKAVIAYHGRLTTDYDYISQYLVKKKAQ